MAGVSKRRKELLQTLETERFSLVPVGPLTAMRITNSWRSDPDILAGIYYSSKPRSLLRWLRSGPIPNNVNRFLYAIYPRGSDKPIGAHMVKMRGYKSAFFAVAIPDRDWWGKGVVVEARVKIMNHFFRHGGLERIYGTVDARNTASVFNYKRLGFDHVGTWHRHQQNPVTGDVIDILNFEIFRDKWEKGSFAEKTDGS